MRIVIYAINGKGMGHLNRTSILARAARQAAPAVDIRFLVGSPLFGMLADAGFEVVKVPDRHQAMGFFCGMNQRPTHMARHFRGLLEHYQPDVFVTDFAINAAMFKEAKRLGARIAVVLRKQRPNDLRRLMLMPSVRHIDRFLLPHAPAEWPLQELPALVRKRAAHLGPVVRTIDPDRVPQVRERYAGPHERLIVVTIGGGGYQEAFRLLEVARLAAGRLCRDSADRAIRWLLVYGPYFPEEVPASEGNVLRIRYEAFMPELMRAADVVVCNAGYNTIHEVQLSGTPAVVVPRRTRGRDDQVERAEDFAGSGRALLADEDPDALVHAVQRLLHEQVVQRVTVSPSDENQRLGEVFLTALGCSLPGHPARSGGSPS